ncbi:hypothetical protein IGI04_035008 [Brassica rapa subsp. trilocularis]|uniref:Uncharacterized protein n=1 Tax=Brassica rapa subsp. trilocularis TaxID=1813537 RepID=A0ABQ7LAE7_BRACM|nr:hypothetical protein IGI04_035008 [Brassica rapa subsp. trilocularis]
MHRIFFFLELMKIFRGNSDGYLRIPTENIRRTLGFINSKRIFFPISLFFLSGDLSLLPAKCIPRDIPTTSFSEYSEDFPTNWWSSEFPRKLISSEFLRKFPRDFREKMNFRGVISEDFFRRYVVGIALFRRHTDDFFPQYAAVFL